jgi:hypothetical protein
MGMAQPPDFVELVRAACLADGLRSQSFTPHPQLAVIPLALTAGRGRSEGSPCD